MSAGKPETSHFLLPGAFFAQDEDCVITTVLGSCISVCFWDTKLRRGGMNHFKLPHWNGDGLPSPKFGNIAITKLLENLYGMGCQKRNLQAKVFGGAAVIKSASGLLNVGDRNIEVARDQLAREGIPVVAQNVGGVCSRKVIFKTADGSVMMKKADPR